MRATCKAEVVEPLVVAALAVVTSQVEAKVVVARAVVTGHEMATRKSPGVTEMVKAHLAMERARRTEKLGLKRWFLMMAYM